MKYAGLSDKTIKWLHSYLTKRAFFFSLDNLFSEAGTTNCRVPQGSILSGSLLFLLYVNDIPQAHIVIYSNSHIYLYAHDTSIFYQHKDIKGIENVLNKKFTNMFE